MSEFKGTKGKWYMHKVFSEPLESTDAETGETWEHQSVWIMGGGRKIADSSYGTSVIGAETREQMEANALLISKAPELLEMLQSVLDLQMSNYGNGMNTHLALIVKGKEIEKLIKESTEI